MLALNRSKTIALEAAASDELLESLLKQHRKDSDLDLHRKQPSSLSDLYASLAACDYASDQNQRTQTNFGNDLMPANIPPSLRQRCLMKGVNVPERTSGLSSAAAGAHGNTPNG